MPNSRNAAKASRQSEKRRLRNRAAKSTLRSVMKKVRDAVAAGDATAAKSSFATAVRQLDRAASKKFIHRNKAARLKSRLHALVSRSGSPSA
jgi:small subunit ribosomal protein S20